MPEYRGKKVSPTLAFVSQLCQYGSALRHQAQSGTTGPRFSQALPSFANNEPWCYERVEVHLLPVIVEHTEVSLC
jgi:hypothetical protein